MVVVLDWPGRSHCFGFGVGDSAAAAAAGAAVAVAAAVVVVGSLKGPYPDWIDSDYPLPTAVGLHMPSWDQGDLPPIEDPSSEPEEYASLMYPFIPYFCRDQSRRGRIAGYAPLRSWFWWWWVEVCFVEDRTDRSQNRRSKGRRVWPGRTANEGY